MSGRYHPSPQKHILSPEQRKAFGEVLGVLNDRERRIFEGRYLAEDPITLSKFGDEFRLSRERVRQIEVHAFEKMQKAVAIASLFSLADAFEQLKEKSSFFSAEQRQKMKADGMRPETIKSRMKKGMTFEQAVITPSSFFSAEQRQKMKADGMRSATVKSLMKKMGMSFEQAVTTPIKRAVEKTKLEEGDASWDGCIETYRSIFN